MDATPGGLPGAPHVRVCADQFLELSLTVPIVNTLAFLFTVVGDWWVDGKVISRSMSSCLQPLLVRPYVNKSPRHHGRYGSVFSRNCVMRTKQKRIKIYLVIFLKILHDEAQCDSRCRL